MGKKMKKNKQEKTSQNGIETPMEPSQDDNVGLSKKSKKIKKREKQLAAAVIPEQVVEDLKNGKIDSTKPKKKKKDKQVPLADEQPVEDKPEKPKAKKSSKHSKKEKKVSKQKTIAADNDVVTSESESEDEGGDQSTEMDKVNQSILNQHTNPEENSSDEDANPSEDKNSSPVKDAAKKSTRIQGPEYSVFVGNLPTTMKKSAMKTLFKPYGHVQTIRFRTSDGVSLFKKKDRKEAKALICYVRFSSKEEAQAACVMNGQTVEGNRIRVSLHSQKHQGHVASTVFVGNIHRKTTDNELYDFFGRVGEIEYVRQISDKGIGYVCFKKGVSIAKALKLNQQLLNGRPLRISKVDPNLQHKRKNKKGNLVDKNPRLAAVTGAAKRFAQKGKPQEKNKTDYHGTMAKKQTGKKFKPHKKGGAEMQKKILAQKLTAARGVKKSR